MRRSKPFPTACRLSAARHGWATLRTPGAPELIFAKDGRTFAAALNPPDARRHAYAKLREAGLSVYVPASAAEWAAILAFENRVADST